MPPTPLTEPVLDLEEIQGNILAGFNKDHQILLLLQIRVVDAAPIAPGEAPERCSHDPQRRDHGRASA